jgi:eukaryotic-like serine/threonine-protein kinase
LLRRLIDACNAVAYAHSRGVLHRDLKPQNVMLGKFGETLVLDWGLAKIGIEPQKRESHEATTDPVVRPSSGSDHAGTVAGAALGTPGYMSPEQAAGRLDLLCPASDVYSLGASLYVLVTGARPTAESNSLPDSGTDRDDSERTSPGPRPPAVLMAVCDKAMAAQPADRYPTPLDLAADLERWLADEPVSVYTDPWPVRATRWGRRHRTAVAAGLVFLVSAVAALSIGSGLLWREERKTAEQKRVAEENYELVRRMSGGIELIASSEAELAADPVKHATRKEVLVAAATAFRKHLVRYPDNPDVRRQAARVYRYAANVHRLEREYAAAEPLYRDAVELLEGLAAENKDEPAYRLQLCETLRDQATVRSTLGRLADAVTALTRVIELADELLATDPKNLGYRRARATGLLNRSTVEYARGNFAQAGMDAAQAAELFRALDQVPRGAHPYDGLFRAAALNVMAQIERESGRPEKAAALHSEAVGLVAKLVNVDRPGLNRDDVLDIRSFLLLEQCRTLKSKAALRKQVENILTGVARQWELLAANNKTIPQ